MTAVNQELNEVLNNQKRLRTIPDPQLKTHLEALAKAKNIDELKAAYDLFRVRFATPLSDGNIENQDPSLDELRQNARKAWILYSIEKHKEDFGFLKALVAGAINDATYLTPIVLGGLSMDQVGLVALDDAKKTEIKKAAQEYYIRLVLQNDSALASEVLTQQDAAQILKAKGHPVTDDFTLTRANLNVAALAVSNKELNDMTPQQIAAINLNSWVKKPYLDDTSKHALKVNIATTQLALALDDSPVDTLKHLVAAKDVNEAKASLRTILQEIVDVSITDDESLYPFRKRALQRLITKVEVNHIAQMQTLNNAQNHAEVLAALQALLPDAGIGDIDMAVYNTDLKPLVTARFTELQRLQRQAQNQEVLNRIQNMSLADAQTVMKAKDVATMQPLVQEATADNLALLRQTARARYVAEKARALSADPAELTAEITASRARVNILRRVDQDEFVGINEKRDLLKRMGNPRFNPKHWFNPAFGAYVRENAKRLDSELKDLDNTVSNARALLLNEKEQLDAIKEQVHDNKALDKQLEIVNEGLAIYQPVYDNLHGVNGRQGLLSMIEKAKEEQGKQVFFREFDLVAVGQNVSQPAGSSQLNCHGGMPPLFYETMNAPTPERPQTYEFRKNNETIGSFTQSIPSTEQVAPQRVVDGLLVTPKPMQINVNTFPEGKENGTQTNKLKFAMGIASQLLGNMDGPPTKNDPIVIRGQHAEELKYIWTALMILGQNTPHMRFGPDDVVVRSTAFSPRTELRSKKSHMLNFAFDSHSRFNDDSLYKTLISQPNVVDTYLPGMKEMAEHKYGHQSARKAVEKDAKAITQMFKKEAQDGRKPIDEITEEVQNQGGLRPGA